MPTIASIKKENQKIRARQMDAPIVPYKGRYGLDCHTAMVSSIQAGFCKEMFDALVIYSEMFPDFDVLALMERYNQFLLQKERANAEGCYIEDCASPSGRAQVESKVESTIRNFGMTLDELEKRQGGKLSR